VKTSTYLKLAPLSLAVALALSACSSGGGGSAATNDTTSETEVTGIAEAPGGQIAYFKHNQSLLVAAIEHIFPGAYAAITGLEPVTGATVELIRVDNDGNQVGDVLASTVTTITGEYSLALPSGVDFSGDLILRITGNSGNSMSAQVVEQEVDINPISQYILDKFIEDGTELATLPVNEVVALTGKVEEFDLTAAPGSNLETMLNQLEAEVGTFVDNSIAVINSEPGNGALAAGNWKLTAISFGFHDSDGKAWGTYSMSVDNTELAVADAGDGTINITVGASDYSWTNAGTNGSSVDIYTESEISNDEDVLSGTIDSNGDLAIPFPFEEELQTVDTQVDLDGPDYGWRWPPGTFLAQDTGNGNMKLSINRDAGVRYETIDTNNDGVKDAIDPDARDGDEVHFEMAFLVKEGSGMSETDVSGPYGMVSYEVEVSNAPEGRLRSTVGPVSFNGSGTVSITGAELEKYEIVRTPAVPPAVDLAFNSSADTDDSLSYTVSADGEFDIGSGLVQGVVSDDGSLMVSVGHDTQIDPQDVQNPDDDIVTDVMNEIRFFVALDQGGNVNQADFANTTYVLRPLIQGADETGRQSVFTLSAGSTMVFDATADNVVITPSDRGIERANDIAEIEAIPVETPQQLTLPAEISNNGSLNILAGDSSVDMDGFMSADKSMFIARLYITNDQGASQDMGLVVGIKQ
jgi:hypothetical protein